MTREPDDRPRGASDDRAWDPFDDRAAAERWPPAADSDLEGTRPSLSRTQADDLPGLLTGDSAALAPGARVGLTEGQVLAGRYEVRALLGAGGMGAVYAAFDQNRGEEIAIKVLLPSLLKNEAARTRFHQEATLSSKLSHPHVVNVYDVQQAGDYWFLTMERLVGRTLRARMQAQQERGEPWSVGEALDLLGPVFDALTYAHERGAVHRDVKPENVYLAEEGGAQTVKLLDFGIARLMSASQLTMTSASLGTAYYMAPEQLGQDGAVDARADQYSLGVVLYELLAGKLPTGRAKSLSELRADIPTGLSDAIDRALEADAEDRFGSVAELRDALERSGSGSKPARSAVSGQRGGGRGAALKAGLAVLVLAVLGLGFVFRGDLSQLARSWTRDEALQREVAELRAEVGQELEVSSRLAASFPAIDDSGLPEIETSLRAADAASGEADDAEAKRLLEGARAELEDWQSKRNEVALAAIGVRAATAEATVRKLETRRNEAARARDDQRTAMTERMLDLWDEAPAQRLNELSARLREAGNQRNATLALGLLAFEAAPGEERRTVEAELEDLNAWWRDAPAGLRALDEHQPVRDALLPRLEPLPQGPRRRALAAALRDADLDLRTSLSEGRGSRLGSAVDAIAQDLEELEGRIERFEQSTVRFTEAARALDTTRDLLAQPPFNERPEGTEDLHDSLEELSARKVEFEAQLVAGNGSLVDTELDEFHRKGLALLQRIQAIMATDGATHGHLMRVVAAYVESFGELSPGLQAEYETELARLRSGALDGEVSEDPEDQTVTGVESMLLEMVEARLIEQLGLFSLDHEEPDLLSITPSIESWAQRAYPYGKGDGWKLATPRQKAAANRAYSYRNRARICCDALDAARRFARHFEASTGLPIHAMPRHAAFVARVDELKRLENAGESIREIFAFSVWDLAKGWIADGRAHEAVRLANAWNAAVGEEHFLSKDVAGFILDDAAPRFRVESIPEGLHYRIDGVRQASPTPAVVKDFDLGNEYRFEIEPQRKDGVYLVSEPVVVTAEWGRQDVQLTAREVPRASAGGRRSAKTLRNLELVEVRPGWFRMGPSSKSHDVEITRPYWIATTEITQRQFEVFGELERPWEDFSIKGPRRPAVMVSDADAERFCHLLTERERRAGGVPNGYEYRLPTEAEWECACRAGTDTVYAFGDSISARNAHLVFDGPLGPLLDVGSLTPNAWGLYDVHGNASELCLDDYDDFRYQAHLDHLGPLAQDPFFQVDPAIKRAFAEDGLRIPWHKACRGGSSLSHEWSPEATTCAGRAKQDRLSGIRIVLGPILER